MLKNTDNHIELAKDTRDKDTFQQYIFQIVSILKRHIFEKSNNDKKNNSSNHLIKSIGSKTEFSLDLLEREKEILSTEIKLPYSAIWKDNKDAETIIDQKLQERLTAKSEDTYLKIVEDIVAKSATQLNTQNESKNKMKRIFLNFFIWFILVQYLVLAIIMITKVYWHTYLSDSVLNTYITACFAETLGAIILMVKYAFDSQQEVQILRILNDVISNFQKFGYENASNEKNKKK